MIGRPLKEHYNDTDRLGKELRKACIVSPGGITLPAFRANGWSILLSGGPNDKLGQLSNPPTWRLSGKRLDGRRPTEEQLQWLQRVALSASSQEVCAEELIVGTWHFTWYEMNTELLS
jgi:hypothetical protein